MLYTLNALNQFVGKYQKYIKDIKITQFHRFGFNDMEGYQYHINFKVVTVDGYRNKLVKVLTNSTYMDDYGEDENDMKENLLDSLFA